MLYVDTVTDGLLVTGTDISHTEMTPEQLTESLRPTFADMGLEITGWEATDFSDCWRKTYHQPELDADGNAELDGIKCMVQAPGTHPGARAWWLTPVENVFTPTVRELDKD